MIGSEILFSERKFSFQNSKPIRCTGFKFLARSENSNFPQQNYDSNIDIIFFYLDTFNLVFEKVLDF